VLLEHATSDEPPMGQLVDESLRAGRRLHRRRRTGAATASVAGVALIAAAATLAGTPRTPVHRQSAATGPSAPTAYVWTAVGDRGTTYTAASDVIPIRLSTGKTLRPLRVRGRVAEIVAAPDGRALYAFTYVVHSSGSEDFYMTRITTGTDSVGRPIRLAFGVQQNSEVEVAPGGRVAYAGELSGLIAINLRSGAERRLLPFASRFAIAPNGRMAYVAGFAAGLVPVDLVTGRALPPIKMPGLVQAVAIALDGRSAYVLGQRNRQQALVVPVSTARNTAGKPIDVRIDGGVALVGGILITPDGKTAYVDGGGYVTPVDLATDRALAPITVPAYFIDDLGVMLMSPDGKVVYDLPFTNWIQPIDVASDTALARVLLPPGFAPAIPAFAPDGKVLYFAASAQRRGLPAEGLIVPIDTVTQRVEKAITLPAVPQQIVVIP